MKKTNLLYIIIATTLLLMGCDESNSLVTVEELPQTVETQIIEDDFPNILELSLSDSERDGLIFMREEEKLARDVYLYFYQKYNAEIFKNISAAESTHMASLKSLYVKSYKKCSLKY